ncbi:D-alanyl-D-alanine carboxypeptidase/D-alanyl-D-alanine-endopeptidase [Corynebacterium sp. CCM 9185]|uniref:D-alanyl-D-alanine carboxypeptidase/D-alanyl-D-alanine-endopeptidase n=1 Tax=Corynebacterium marambiense TaxID=2765364 RepID=A0ABS0VWB2_9CORY|nr:D-alanyl-D-alanine carboxypeptidase/D-alanyl-D-alanine-endopeptidase [Corynebacterium marambiense]MBI9001044.1 D-alanyl-D-alanine carboxypeptidase/D-alanyl-D-alanine-endopeptidase [Corynebacterium marambiense]MCK7664285.1 D-alanyl-D-alanine carboxypeptidase/D-alanyl-D-alanine-endopeptidase [Corynebacterium marambiense]MCX7543098.1 D-alanyl-D-alanine carboxypeptidase/D-alanyl-D-alanine-endopeptidase [Corynebacterium marambiense]
MARTDWWWVISAVLVMATAGGVTTVAALRAEADRALTHGAPLTVSRPTEAITPAPTDGQPDGDDPDTVELVARLDGFAADPRLGHLVGSVTDATTGEVIWTRDAGAEVRPASTVKVLTAAAALLTFGPEQTITTSVVEGPEPGTAVLVGAGDVDLGAEQLDELAADIRTHLPGEDPVDVFVDTTRWSADNFAPGWYRDDIAAGYITPMDPVMMNRGLVDAANAHGPRSAEPAIDVSRALGERLGARRFGYTTAPTDSRILASVTSAPLADRLGLMMRMSDNVAAEALGRELALTRGLPADAAGAGRAVLDILQEHGITVSAARLDDTSGLSGEDRVSTGLLDAVLTAAARGTELRPLLDTLPVAAATGTLSNRFDNRAGRGWVRAKTGTLTDTSALAGTVTSDNGRVYTFAFISNGSEILPARDALDGLASALRAG